MDDFRTQLRDVIDGMLAAGVTPIFLVADLEGAAEIKRVRDQDSLDKFMQAATTAITAVAPDADTFTYGDERIVAIMPELPRLTTFALIDRLRRALPLLGQSFDCTIYPEFDVLDYDPQTGVSGLLAELSALGRRRDDVA
jgi:hypothetical protein